MDGSSDVIGDSANDTSGLIGCYGDTSEMAIACSGPDTYLRCVDIDMLSGDCQFLCGARWQPV